MLCDVCQKNEATVYLTQIVEGKMQKVNLCESCAKDKGLLPFTAEQSLLARSTQNEAGTKHACRRDPSSDNKRGAWQLAPGND